MTDRFDIPENITPPPPPRKCPEANPQQNISRFMRDIWLPDRLCKPCDDIVDHRCEARNELADQPRRIMSIGMRERARRF